MRKIFSIFISILLVSVLAVCAYAVTYKLGDVNKDGKITASDARIVLRTAAKLDDFENDSQELIADVNGDGKVNVTDARLVLRISAKLDEEAGDIEIDDVTDTDDTTDLANDNTSSDSTTSSAETTTVSALAEGEIAYSSFPEEMKLFLSGTFGFSGHMGTNDDMQNVVVKSDGTNVKVTTTMDMDEYGDVTVSIITKTTTGIFGNETTSTYIVCDTTGYYMDMTAFQVAAAIFGAGDLELDVSGITFGVENLNDSMTAQKTEITSDGIDYTVYSVDKEESTVDFYFDDTQLKKIVTCSKTDATESVFVIDEFYTDITSSDFSLSNYSLATGILTLFGFSL